MCWAEIILVRQKVFVIRSNLDQSQIEEFLLTLEDGKRALRQVQAGHTQFLVKRVVCEEFCKC